MKKSEIINDMKFRHTCSTYGFDWEKFEICNNVIIVSSYINQNLFLLLDENYNIIGIHKINNSKNVIEETAKKYNEYHNNEINTSKNKLPIPFQKYSMKQLLDLNDRIEERGYNNGHSTYLIINDNLIEFDQEDKKYVNLLYYIKFFGNIIHEYYLNYYHMLMLDFKYPTVYEYVNIINDKINNYVTDNQNKRINPVQVIGYLGFSKSKIEYYINEINEIIELLTNENIESISNEALKLLKILEMPKEAAKKEIGFSINSFELSTKNFKDLISDQKFNLENEPGKKLSYNKNK